MNERELKSLLENLPRKALSRRAMFRGAGAAGVAAFLAACGIGGEDDTPAGAGASPADELTTTRITGELDFANWPLYIDKAKGRRPTLDDFTEATDIKVNYDEVINDNQSFFGRIREPLSSGQPIEWDLIVVTDWLIAKMIRLGYLEQLDPERIPNFFEHSADIYKSRVYDPGNKFSIPWQSGITGIGYDPNLTGREITKFGDLFDEEFKGKVGMLSEMRDTMNLTLLHLGIQPQDATLEDAERAQQKLLEQRDAGVVRQYYGNDYADALAKGDLAISMAWSGDIFQLQFDNPDLQFVVPEEGGILWTDNMAIPQNAPHPIDALEFMNFVYDPEIAAQIAGWVNYITPVPAAKEFLLQRAEKENDNYFKQVANSPLVFTTPEMEGRVFSYRDLSEEEEAAWNELFNEVIQG